MCTLSTAFPIKGQGSIVQWLALTNNWKDSSAVPCPREVTAISSEALICIVKVQTSAKRTKQNKQSMRENFKEQTSKGILAMPEFHSEKIQIRSSIFLCSKSPFKCDISPTWITLLCSGKADCWTREQGMHQFHCMYAPRAENNSKDLPTRTWQTTRKIACSFLHKNAVPVRNLSCLS